MQKGMLALLCVALIVAVPACRKNSDEGKMKKQKTEKKTYSKKNKKGGMVEETTTTKSETTQRMAQPVK
jgi:Flp pilus assembly protein TadD